MEKQTKVIREIELFALEQTGRYPQHTNAAQRLKIYDAMCRRYKRRLSRQEFGRARLIIENTLFGSQYYKQ